MASRPLTKLTDKAVANLKPRPTRYQAFDEGCPGLSIRVTPTGGKSWVWQYREHVATSGGYEPGKRTRFWTLGTYPALSLRDARALTEKARSLLKTRGVDPADGKREVSTAQTFGELATDYLERRAKKYKKSWREDRRQLIADVLPAWQSRLVKTLTRRDVHALCDRIIDRGAPVAANQLQLRTGQRGGEISTMAWGDVDLATGWWTIQSASGLPGTIQILLKLVFIMIRNFRGIPGQSDSALTNAETLD